MVLARRNNHVTLPIKQIYLDMEKENLCFVNTDILWSADETQMIPTKMRKFCFL